MNAYLSLPLIQTLFSLVLVTVVLKGHFRNSSHRLFSLYLLSLAIWGVIIFGMRASPDIEHAYAWEKWLIPLGPMISVLFYHFAVRYTASKVRRWLLPLCYAICLILIPLATTDLFFSGMQVKPYGYAPIFGPAIPFWMLLSYALPIMAFLILIRTHRTSFYAEQRNRVAYLIVGMICMFVGGAFDILPVLGLPLYPGQIIGNVAFCLVSTVAIVKHNLLDIRVVLRKSIAYILTSALIAIPFVGIFLLVTNFLTEQTLAPWIYFLLLLALAFFLPPFWQRVQRWVDRWFYRDRYNYLKALETFARGTQSITDFATLGSTMVNLVAGALRPSSVCLLQPLPSSGDFAVLSSVGMNGSAVNIHVGASSPLIKWLKHAEGMLSCQDLDRIPQLQSVISREKEALKRIGGELIIPLKAGAGQLSGLVILGRKLSEQPYTIEDKQLIYTLARQITSNLENARLYSDVVQARKNLELWLNSMSDCVIIVGTDYTVQFANKAVAEKFSNKAAAICWELLGKDAECSDCPIQHYSRTNTEAHHWVTNIGDRQYDVAAAPLLGPGDSVSVVEVLRDITELKRAQEEERKLQQELSLSSRLVSIGELAAGIAHEINNPLTGILGFSQRALRKSTDETLKRDLERIYEEAQRAARVVDNLRTFARRRETRKERINIDDVLQKAMEMRLYELKTGNIEVLADTTAGLPRIMADFHQIQQVFLNIIMNAEQAMTEANGRGKLVIKADKHKGHITITFTDDGPGILKENLGKLFDPFFTTREEKGGTGLGLSICHRIVTEHGGRIYAKSKRGKGTTFFVELPLTTESMDDDRVSQEESIHRSK